MIHVLQMERRVWTNSSVILILDCLAYAHDALISCVNTSYTSYNMLLKVPSDILAASDDGRVPLLGLLDMSAAFDTVDHHILL